MQKDIWQSHNLWKIPLLLTTELIRLHEMLQQFLCGGYVMWNGVENIRYERRRQICINKCKHISALQLPIINDRRKGEVTCIP